MNNEFYIGWVPDAPPSFAKFLQKFLLVLAIIIFVSAILLAVSQKRFSTANFEYGILTEVKGIYFDKPVPSIKTINGKDIFGNLSYITIPLVGFGKMGASGIIGDMEKEKHSSLDQREIILKGTLLYNDGKLLMQIDSNDKPVTGIGNKADASLFPVQQRLGTMTIEGEIIDAKCYFGVMKPAQGKPHKDCAIRCILGGIPPMLRVADEAGAANYYLLVGPHGEKMNEAVRDFVAEPVSIEANAVQYGDWIVLYAGSENIKAISKRETIYAGKQAIACVGNCGK